MSVKPNRLIVIVAATLALAACQQKSEQSEQAPATAEPAPMSAPSTTGTNTSDTNTSAANTGEAMSSAMTQAAAPAATAEPAATPAPQAEPAAPATAMKQAATMAESTATAPAKPAAMAPEPAKPEPSAAMTAKPAAAAPATPEPAPMAETFNTLKCKACHAIDQDKVGPAWKTVVEKYGDAATLAKDFESGFKERRVANAISKWKSKEALMTPQFKHLIKGHEKAAAHALFETVKQGKFGNY